MVVLNKEWLTFYSGSKAWGEMKWQCYYWPHRWKGFGQEIKRSNLSHTLLLLSDRNLHPRPWTRSRGGVTTAGCVTCSIVTAHPPNHKIISESSTQGEHPFGYMHNPLNRNPPICQIKILDIWNWNFYHLVNQLSGRSEGGGGGGERNNKH